MSVDTVAHKCECKGIPYAIHYDKYTDQYFCEDCSGIIEEDLAEYLVERTQHELKRSKHEQEAIRN